MANLAFFSLYNAFNQPQILLTDKKLYFTKIDNFTLQKEIFTPAMLEFLNQMIYFSFN